MTTLAAKPTKPTKKPVFDVIETAYGTWKKHFDEKGNSTYTEFTSDAEFFGWPLISIVQGFDPRTKKMGTADGFIAIGQRARGAIAIGQFCNGYIFSMGQFCTSRVAAVGQFAVAPLALGQMTFGFLALGQMGIGAAGLFQFGLSM